MPGFSAPVHSAGTVKGAWPWVLAFTRPPQAWEFAAYAGVVPATLASSANGTPSRMTVRLMDDWRAISARWILFLFVMETQPFW